MHAELFKRCMKNLHGNYPAAEASTLIDCGNISGAINMLQGRLFALATFVSNKSLLDAILKSFTKLGFSEVYGSIRDHSDMPSFILAKLDTDKMARIGFDMNLTVVDFLEPETLLETVLNAKSATGIYLQYTSRLSENPILSAGATLLETLAPAEAWHDAAAKVKPSTGLG
ncbi:hypothetical protein GGS21DRAFT_491716 [Xylaria nigripes]|nr:hypothetical protein GGS21DRAFT_491716 [Xylaria nigripes]